MDLQIILKFLKDISKHNDREWFEKNKGRYLEAKQGFEGLVTEILNELIKFDGSLAGLNARKLPFRIYRDVRFSKDKRPYKTNMGAGFSPNGKMEQEPGYYLHIQPGDKSFIAGGIYMPDSENLGKIRQEIDYNYQALKKIIGAKEFRKYFSDFDRFDSLKTAPKGYPKDHPYINLLKLKSFVVSHPFTDKQVTDRRFVKTVAKVCKIIKPLNDFIKEAVH
jgi:uncharacterized protein (TIGR02453 family)